MPFSRVHSSKLSKTPKFSENFVEFIFSNGNLPTFCENYFSELPQTTVLCGYHFYEAKYKKLGSAKVKATKINLNCRKLTIVAQSSILDATGFLKFWCRTWLSLLFSGTYFEFKNMQFSTLFLLYFIRLSLHSHRVEFW